MKFPLIVFTLLLAACTTTSPSPTLPAKVTEAPKPQTSKGDYKELGIPPAFKKLYDEAKAKNESWLTKAEEVASQAAGKGSDKISIFNSAPDKAIAIVLSGNLEDDSVKQIEKWIELTKKGEAWEVDWIGARFMCRRGGNTTQWQKEFCP